MATIPISFAGGGGSGSDDVTASSAQVLKGYTAITSDSDDEPKEGTIPSKLAQTYYASTADQTILSGQYLAENQIIKAVSQSNLSAGTIKKGTTVSDSNGNGNLWSVDGTYSTPSSGQSPIVAGAVRSGYSGFVNGGGEIQGTIPNQAAKTVYVTMSSQTAVASGYYTTGNVNVAALSQSGLSPSNILRNKTISISNGSVNVWSVTGDTSGGIKCVHGTVLTNNWWDPGDGNTVYNVPTGFADIAPGITPIYVTTSCEGGAVGTHGVWTVNDFILYAHYEPEHHQRYKQMYWSLPRSASQTRIIGVFPQSTIIQPMTEYYIFGY